MANRVVVRFSLNADTGSTVRNSTIDPILTTAGFQNTGTGTYEANLTGMNQPKIDAVGKAAGNAIEALIKLNGPVTLDHVWFVAY